MDPGEVTEAFLAACYEGDAYRALSLIADGYRLWERGQLVASGPRDVEQRIHALRRAFPDFRQVIERQIVLGDEVVAEWTATGTQQDEFIGIPSRGRQIRFSGITWCRVQAGKITEARSWWDRLDLLAQL
jgi:steroid delta-isomerase-like uncharacterized protein